MAWVAEANAPEDWAIHAMSAIVRDAGCFVVYVGGWNVQKFYKYNLDTDTWIELAVPPAVLYLSLSMSPDESKLAGHGVSGSYLYIYDITSGTWTTSSAAPTIPACNPTDIFGTVWADNDTIWCQVRGYNPSIPRDDVKFMKYTVSTDTWTQYPNFISPSVVISFCMCIRTDGTALYAGNLGAAYNYTTKYTIATDTYASGPTLPSAHYFILSADRHKLWWGPHRSAPADHQTITRWINPDTEVLEGDVFTEYDNGNNPTLLSAGVYGLLVCMADHRISNPKFYSESYWSPPVGMAGLNPALVELLVGV